jgi:hypothetical protein
VGKIGSWYVLLIIGKFEILRNKFD